jgi:hypothetical protein
VRDVLKDVLLPWYNAYRFFIQNVFRLHKVRTTLVCICWAMRWACVGPSGHFIVPSAAVR